MNLREDKHWSYGARTQLIDARGPRSFLVNAPVQTDKTKESMQEIYKELTGIRSDRPITSDELGKAKDLRTLTLPGRWETNSAIMQDLVQMLRFDLPADYYEDYVTRVRSLDVADVVSAAQTVIEPQRLIWVVVGDRAVIESGLHELALGDVHHLDVDGNLIQ